MRFRSASRELRLIVTCGSRTTRGPLCSVGRRDAFADEARRQMGPEPTENIAEPKWSKTRTMKALRWHGKADGASRPS